MKIVVLGAGYVGLVSAACFAEFGITVTCIDRNEERIEGLRNGVIPIYEPGLDELVLKNIKRGNIFFDTSLAAPMVTADAVFIAVGTPSRHGDGYADLSYVYEAAKDIAKNLSRYTVVVTKSTVPVGTGREVEKIIHETNPKGDFDVCSNPEFLREGSAIEDFMRPDRVVIGCETDRAAAVMRELYRPLYLIETPIVMTNLETAELTKYAANAFLATKITFINEIADLCEKVGADVQTVAKGMGLDGRIGRKFLHAGPGYGGSCFPKDTLALVRTAKDKGAPMRLVETTVDINDKRKQHMAERVILACGGSVKGKTISVLGVTFKPNTDDMRDSVALDVLPALQKAGATVRAYDPAGMKEASHLIPNVVWCEDTYAALEGGDAVVILTEWNEFRALDFDRVKKTLKTPIMVDLRNIYKPADMAANGFIYSSIGRAIKLASPRLATVAKSA